MGLILINLTHAYPCVISATEIFCILISKAHKTHRPSFSSHFSNLRTNFQECAINKREGENRQNEWDKKLGTGKNDLAATLMMSNPYTGSAGRLWWRGQAWFMTMTVLGEWRWALPEAEWEVCKCVCICVNVCVCSADPKLGRILNGNRLSSDQVNTGMYTPKKTKQKKTKHRK